MAAAGVPHGARHVLHDPRGGRARALDAFGAAVRREGRRPRRRQGRGRHRPTGTRRWPTRPACERVVVEEFLDGPEVSLFAVTDGTTAVPLQPAQDFKRIFDGDARPQHRRHGRLHARCRGRRADLVEQVLATVAAARPSTRCAAGHAVRRRCCTSASR